MSEPYKVDTRVRIGNSEYDEDLKDPSTAIFKGTLGTITEVVPDSTDNLYHVKLDKAFHGMHIWAFYGDEFEVIGTA